MKTKPTLRLLLAALGSSIFAVSSAHAQSGTWDVNAGGDWSTTTNWAGGTVADGSGNTALFSMTTGGATRTINVDTPRTIGNITRSWAFGNQLVISGSAITLAGTTPTITNNNAGSASRITISSQILGSDGLNIAGGGFVELTGNTTNYSGATTITGGSFLSLGAIPLANIGGGSGRNISVGAGSTVHRTWQNLDNDFLNRITQTNDEIGIFMSATGSSNNNNNLDFSSAGADLPNAFFGSWSSNGAIARYNGVITPASDNYRIGITGSSGALHIMQPLTDIAGDPRGLIIGGGTPILAADNTFTGDTVLRDGRLFIGKQLALQNSALNVGNGSDGINGQFVFTNGPGGAAPALDVVNAPTIGGLIGSRNLAAIYNSANQNNTNRLAASAVLGITLNTGTDKSYNYGGNVALNSTMSLTKTGEGTQILSGDNTYNGDTLVNAGTLLINGSTSSGSTVSVDSGAIIGGSGTIQGDLNLSSGALFAFDPNTTLTLDGTLTLDSSFGVGSLRNMFGEAIDWSLIADDTYTLLNTNFVFNAGNISNFGSSNSFNIGGGRVAYFQNGSLELVVIPEPTTALLGGLGVLALLRRRR